MTKGAIAAAIEALGGCLEHMEWSTPQGQKAYADVKQALADLKALVERVPDDLGDAVNNVIMSSDNPDCIRRLQARAEAAAILHEGIKE